MVNYHRNEVVCELVSYIERYRPDVLFVVRHEDIKHKIGLPDIIILERSAKHLGLSMWVTPRLTKSEERYRERFAGSGHDAIVSDDLSTLKLGLRAHLSSVSSDVIRLRNKKQLDKIRDLNDDGVRGYHPERRSLTSIDYDTLRGVVSYVKDKYRGVAIMPSFGYGHGPDLVIVSHSGVYDGFALWFSNTSKCYAFFTLTDQQVNCLAAFAKGSYLTIASDDYQDITDIVDDYMAGEYGNGSCLPKFCDEDCP